MKWYSIFGTGSVIHDVQRVDMGPRVEFTSWLSVFWIPLLPLRSWTAVYMGEMPPVGTPDEGNMFFDIRRIPHRGWRLLWTFLRGIIMAIAAIGPIVVVMIFTGGKVARPWDGILVAVNIIWLVSLAAFAGPNRWGSLASKIPMGKYPFVVRCRDGSEVCTIKILGDRWSRGFNIVGLLEENYGISVEPPSEEMMWNGMIANTTLATCEKGVITIDDETWGLYITAEGKTNEIIEDIEALFLASGDFEKREVGQSDST